MKASVIGAGAWGKNIVRTLHAMGVLHSVAEVSGVLRNGLKEQYPGLMLYDSPDAVIASETDMVFIAVPAPQHYEIAKAAIQHGKDVFVEKPMTLSVEDARSLVELADTHNRILMVGHLLLYQPAVQWLRSAISSHLIGDLKSVHQRRLGLGRARDVENVLWSLGVHDVAVALFLVGDKPDAVKVSGHCALQPGIEDDIYLHMTFPGNVQTHLHCSWLWPEKERGLIVVGSAGFLVYDEVAQKVTLHRKRIDAELKNIDDGAEVVYEGAGEPLRLELEHFLECVLNRKQPISDGHNGLEVVRIMQQATERLTA